MARRNQKEDLQRSLNNFIEELVTRNNVSMAKVQKILPNPDPILKAKGRRYEVLSDLEIDSHVESCIQSRMSGVLSMLMQINQGKPASEESTLVERAFKALPMEQIITDILQAPLYGFQPIEIVWHRTSDGHFLPRKVLGKPQDWFAYNDDNECQLKDGKDLISLPHRRFLVPAHKPDYMNPYGKAILSRCFWPVQFKKAVLRFWVEFCERFGFPWVVGTVKDASNDNEKEDMRDDLKDQRQDGVIIKNKSQLIELIESQRSSSVDIFIRLILFCNAEISKAILSQTLTTEQGDTGSYAMAQTHLMVRKDVVDADKKMVENVLNQIAKWIVELNFWQSKDIPTVTLYQEQDVDTALATRDAQLMNSGQVRFTKTYYIRNYGFKEDEIEIVEPAAPGMLADGQPTPTTPRHTPTPAPAKPPIPRGNFLDTSTTDADQAVIDDSTNMDPSHMDEVMKQVLAPVMDMVMAGADFDSVRASLAELFPNMDTATLMKHMTDQLLLAEFVGQASAELENQ